MTFSITGPLNKVVAVLKRGEDGDMRARSEIKQDDELGEVAKSLDQFFEKIQSIVKGLLISSETLAGEATGVMNKLGLAAKEIGQVTDVIKELANQSAGDLKHTVNQFKV